MTPSKHICANCDEYKSMTRTMFNDMFKLLTDQNNTIDALTNELKEYYKKEDEYNKILNLPRDISARY